MLEGDSVSKEASEFSTGVEWQDKIRSVTSCNVFMKRITYGVFLSCKLMTSAV